MQETLYLGFLAMMFMAVVGFAMLAFRPAPEFWNHWWAWRPVQVDGQRRLFTHVMRRRTGSAWEYRDLSSDELREHDDDRTDYQTW